MTNLEKYQAFRNQWPNGSRVDYDNQYAFQCVDLIRQYCRQMFGLNNEAGGVPYAINYWEGTPAGMLSRFQKLATNDVRAGDITVLRTFGSNQNIAPGHIGIATGGINPTQFEMLEQNGSTGNGSGQGNDAIRTRWIDRSRIAGVLRPIEDAPVVVTPPPIVRPYTVEAITPKTVKINKATHRFGLNYDNWTAMAAHPEGDIAAGIPVQVTAKAVHAIGITFYLENKDVPSGYRAEDCDDYTPPVPQGGLTIESTEKYDIVKEVRGFTTSNQAANHIEDNRTVTVRIGTYIIYRKANNMLNITTDGRYPGAWINPNDNQLPPPPPPAPEPVKQSVPLVVNQTVQPMANSVIGNQPIKTLDVSLAPVAVEPITLDLTTKPVDWRTTYVPFPEGVRKFKYVGEPVKIVDIEGVKRSTKEITEGTVLPISGEFEKDGIWYARIDKSVKPEDCDFSWHAIANQDENGIDNFALTDDQRAITVKTAVKGTNVFVEALSRAIQAAANLLDELNDKLNKNQKGNK